ncbi:MAG: hypothetical protein AB7L09_00410 [Nitrospira sp.]
MSGPQKKLHADTIDPEAARRQSITALTNAMVTLQMLRDLGAVSPDYVETFESAYADLTKSRFLLVEHCDPDNLLEELSQL